MALRALVRVEAKIADRSSVPQLYRYLDELVYGMMSLTTDYCYLYTLLIFYCIYHRAIIKELPRVMAIYDVDIQPKAAREAIAYHFRKNHYIHDGKYVFLYYCLDVCMS